MALVVSWCIFSGAHPEEDVSGAVEAGGVNTGGVGRSPITHNPTRKPRDSALQGPHGTVTMPTTSCFCHHNVYRSLCRSTNLREREWR